MNKINNFEEYLSMNEGAFDWIKKMPSPAEMIKKGAESLGIKSFSGNIASILPEVQKAIKNAHDVATDKGKKPYSPKIFRDALMKDASLRKANEAYVKTLEKLLNDAKKDATSFIKAENRSSINSLWMLGKAASDSLAVGGKAVKAAVSSSKPAAATAKPAASTTAAKPATAKPAASTTAAKPAATAKPAAATAKPASDTPATDAK